MNEIADRYRRHADAFEAKVAAVRSDQWTNPSPCEKWTARDVVDHIVAMHGYMLRPIGRSLPPTGGDALTDFRTARAAVEEVLADPELAGQEADTPAGRMTVAEQIDKMVSDDLVLHGWDLARAAGLDDTIDPAEVSAMWPEMQQIPEEMRIPEHFGPGVIVFGPEVPVPDDAPLQDRLLGKIGRDPRWTPPVTPR